MLKPLRQLVILLMVLCSFTAYAEVIEAIRIVGNARISTQAVFYRIRSAEGEELDLATVSEDVKRLWNLNVFADIKVDIQDGETGKVLTYMLRERPIIKDFRFFGNHAFGPNLLKDKLKEEGILLRINTQLDFNEVSRIKMKIMDLYKGKGYQNVRVEQTLESTGAGDAYVTFTIYEGGKVRVHGVQFTGNQVFSDKKLRRAMKKIKEHSMLSFVTSSDVYSEEKFDEDLDNLRSRYWKKGYKDVFVGRPIIEIIDETSEKQKQKNLERMKFNKKVKQDLRMHLTIPIFEGDQYTIGDVSFVDNKLVPDTTLADSWELEPGDPFDVGKVNEFQTEIEEIYNDAGYLQFFMERIPEKRADNRVDLTFKFDEGEQFTLRRLEFEGNVVTRDKVLRREFMISEGAPFRLEIFKNSMLKINQLGFFDVTQSDPDVDLNPEDNSVDVLIKGQESGVNEINFGGGYSEYAGFFLQTSYSTRNFLGRGEQLQLSASLGSNITYYNISFTEPWIFDYPHSFTVNLFNSDTSYYNYERQSKGFSLGFGFRLKPFLTYSVAYRYEIVDVPGSSLQTNSVFKPVSNRLTSSITQSLQYNTLNHPFMATRGSKYALSLEWAGWQLGGDDLKYEINLRLTRMFKGPKSTAFLINSRIGYQKPLGSNNTIQYYDRFFIGGESTVRGYELRTISPRDSQSNYPIGGTKMFMANLEWILPIENRFQFALFYDIGGVWLEDQSFFASEEPLKSSWGVEARFNLPVFQMPIRLTYGIPLDDVYGQDKGGNLEFTVGTIF